ncbi:MAG TPA: hypothetical protein VFT98_23445 [Myxococcota bacterium]|nr:hypothetical protein [Myxococcota bacterium]
MRSAAAHDRRIAWRLACVVALALSLLHRGHFMSTDELGMFFQTKSLAEELSLAVPARVHMAFRGRDARSYSQYVVGQALIAAPLYSLGKALTRGLGERAQRTLAGPVGRSSWQGEPPVGAGAFSVLFYPALVAGALAGVFFLFERRLGASVSAALLASLALAFCTHALLLGTLFLQHGAEALLALAAFFFWHRYRGSGAARDVLLGACCAAALFNVRAAAALNGVALAGYLLFALAERARAERDPARLARALGSAALPVAVSFGFYVAMNWLKWGSWLDSPQLEERSTLGADPRAALYGFLLSPGMSVFVYSPPLLLAPFAFAPFWRRHRAEAIAVLALFLTTLAFYSTYELWTGLFSCPGPRYLFTATVFLLLPLGPWLERTRGLLARASFAALAALGAGVELLSVGVNWGGLVIAGKWGAPFDFVFDWRAAPLFEAARHALDPAYWDLWLARTALGWPGQPGQPALAAALFGLWAVGFAWLALRLRAALREARAAHSAPSA